MKSILSSLVSVAMLAASTPAFAVDASPNIASNASVERPVPHPRPFPRPQPHPQPRPFPQPRPYPQPRPFPQPRPYPQPRPFPHPRPYPQPRPFPHPRPYPQPRPYPPVPYPGGFFVCYTHNIRGQNFQGSSYNLDQAKVEAMRQCRAGLSLVCIEDGCYRR